MSRPDEIFSRVITESENPLDVTQESKENNDDLDTVGLLAPAQGPSASDLLNLCLEHGNFISTIGNETIVEAGKEALAKTLGKST